MVPPEGAGVVTPAYPQTTMPGALEIANATEAVQDCRMTLASNPVQLRSLRRRVETQLRPPMTTGASEQRARHCRSALSNDHFRGQQSCRRGASRQRWCQRTDHQHLRRSEPTLARGCTPGPDRCPSDCACTTRTMQRDAQRGGCGDEAGFLLLRSTRKRKVMRSQKRFYAYRSSFYLLATGC